MMMKNNTTTLSTTATTAAGDAAETSTGVVNVARSVSDNGSDTAGSTKSSSTTSMGILRNRYSSRRSSGDNSPSESGKSASISVVVDEAKQQKQNRKVCMLRTAMILTLVSATVIVAVLVYKYVKRDERNDFETQYEDSVSKVQEAFQYGIDIKHDTASAFSSVYTSQFGNKAQIAEPVWPNATLTHFEEEASDFLTISNGRALSFNPIITQGTNRLEWEAHAAEDAWRFGEESLVIPPPNTTWPDNRTVEFGIYSRDANKTVIYDPGYAPESRYVDVLIPVWQIYPITEKKAIMFNLHSEKNRQRLV
jgi:heme/copper-type cytochrome/quinol oxidase subunit 2